MLAAKRLGEVWLAVLACLLAAGAIALAAGGLTVVERSVKVPKAAHPSGPYPYRSVTAACPKGKRLRLGGFAADAKPNPLSGPQVVALSYLKSANGWKVSGANGGSEPGRLRALAYCGRSGRIKKAVRKTIPVSPHASGTATATCPRGTRVVLGSAQTEYASGGDVRLFVSSMRSPAQRSWSVTAVGGGSVPGDLSAIAYCGKAPPAREVSAKRTLAPGASLATKARCPRGTRVAFGGFSVKWDPTDSDPAALPVKLLRPSARVWTAQALSNPFAGNPSRVTAIAYCR